MPHEVVRSRVLELLDRRWEHMVTTVTAGPGFGKSIAVGQAVRANHALPRGVEAWVSCRSGGSDPGRLVAAVCTAFGADVAGRAPPLAQLQQAVAGVAPIDASLILDDVELLAAAPSGVELVDALLRDLPWNLHVVLCGRRVPAGVGLARLRAADQVVEVGDAELRFDAGEIEALARSAGGVVPERDLGGWPALVRLAVAAPAAVGDFLWDEVIRALSPEDRRALAALSLVGPVAPEDVAAVCGEAFDAAGFCARVPLAHQAEGLVVAHDLWVPFVEAFVPAEEQAALGRRALEVMGGRGDVVAAGALAIRLGDGRALRRAAVGLVRETLTNLPVDLAASWLDAADGKDSPEIELLACALAHAREASEPPPARLAALGVSFRDAGDVDGEALTLALGAIAADATGDIGRLPALAARAEELAADHDDPILWALVDGVRATLAAVSGDIAGALVRLDRRPEGIGRTETVDRLHWRLLLLAGRAGDAARLAAAFDDDEPAAVARWLDGDPSGFDLAQVELRAARYAGVGERERFDRACFVAVLAAATGRSEPVDLAVEVLAASPLVDATPANSARFAAAVAAQRVVAHDDAGAAAAIAAFLDEAPAPGAAVAESPAADAAAPPAAGGDLDPLADAFLRRSLGVPYGCSPVLRRRWDAAELGPSQRRARAIARLLVDARAGRPLGAAPEPVAAVGTVLPLPWSVELAVRAAARGLRWGVVLAEDLADRFGAAAGAELGRLAHAETAELRDGAIAVRRALPTQPQGGLAIRVLGPLEVVRSGAVLDAPELRRARVRELLSVLVAERSVTRERVLDLLWPDLDEARARPNLRVTLSHLQRMLEPDRPVGRPPFFLRTDSERLRLSAVGPLEVDLWRVEAALADAETARLAGDAAAQIRHLSAAVESWRGRPLPDLDAVPALASTGGYLTSRLADACLTLGELELTRGAVGRVAACAERALAADPYRERSHRLAIAAAFQARDRTALESARARLDEMLTDLAVTPEPPTQMLLRQTAAWLTPA